MKAPSKSKSALLAMAGLLMLAAPAKAWTAKGAGECATWSAGEDDRFWLLGFISGVNFAKSSEVAKTQSAESIFEFVDNYCKEHPKDDLADAGAAYIRTQ